MSGPSNSPPDATSVDPAPPRPAGLRRTFSALGYRDFRLLWFGAFTSTTGTWMQTVAQSWIVLSLTGSAFLLGLDGFLATAPMLLFSLFGGVLADRFDRRKLMFVSQLFQMSIAFTLAILIATKSVQVWHIFILSFLTGTAQSLSGPAYVSLLPLLVRREDVPNAIAMNSMQFNLARVIGPILAGLALTTLGAALCFGLNGLSFVAVMLALLLMRPLPPAPERAETSVLHEMKEGVRFVWREPALAQLSLLGFIGTFLGMPLITFLPVVAKTIFDLGPRGYSWLLTAYGLGSVGGALLVAATGHIARKGRLALFLQLAFSLCLALFAFSESLTLTVITAFIAGGCLVGVISMFSSLVQLATTDAMRGRVMSIFMLAFRGGMPLGSLLAGFIAQAYSIRVALAVNAAVLAVVASLFLVARSKVSRI
ncbi:MAG TPA: MFS transporter [Thermoanaerobaculia bacterium]|nr:MFS transporter [Thermoanaerobaculia bacterium]